MFELGKIFWIVVQPLSLAFLMLLAGFLLGGVGLTRIRRTFLLASLLVLFTTLYTTTGSWALGKLEDIYPKPSADPADLSCIIILGGAIDGPVIEARGGTEMNQAADRFIESLRLARAFPQARILVSGGDGSLSGSYPGDAIVSKQFFSTFGIDSSRLILETKSRSTIENAALTKGLLEQNNLSDCLLVTSAFHMARAVGLFEKLGLNVTPWPVDYRTTGDVGLWFDFTQPTLNAQLTASALHEWIGLVAAYLGGHTLHLLPK